jgi:pimeloyl-ACP methyl ester carboxylesterase
VNPLFLAGLGVLLLVVVLNWVTLRILKPVRVPIECDPEALGLKAEPIEFASDGRILRGWMLDGDTDDTRPLVVLAHGWGANTGAVLPLGAALQAIGLDVIMFDFRHHGRSDDAPRVTMLDYADDLQAGVRYARARFPGRHLVLMGHSMGGAASVLAAADGADVDALLLIAAPADFFDVTANYLGGGVKGMAMVFATAPFFLLHVRKWWTSLAPDRHIGDVKVPISIVMGDRDRRVPLSHVYRLAHEAGVEPLILDDTGHRDILENEILHRHALEFVVAQS